MLRGADLKAGAFQETGKLESPISATLMTKGLASGVHLGTASRVQVAAVTADTICGEIDLQGIFDGKKTHVTGTFVAGIAR